MDTRIPGLPDASASAVVQRKPVAVSELSPANSQAPVHVVAEQAVPAASVRQLVEPDSNLNTAVTDMNDFVQSVQRNIAFSVTDDSGELVVSITDRETGDVIRQIPSEEALKLAETLSEARSLLLKAEV